MSAWLYQVFIAPLTETFFQKALFGGGVVALVSGVVGCLVILRRMAFLGDALSHAMIAGVAGGYLFMKVVFGLEAHAPGMLLGSILAAVMTVVLIGFVSRVSRVKEDAAIGIMYTGVFAGGVVLVSVFSNYIHIDLMHFIMGDVLAVSDADLWISAVTAAAVLSAVILFYRHFQLTSFDPVMAASIGMPVVLIDYALTTCVSMVVVSAVSMVGVILVVGLLITPAATAYLLSDRLERMMVLAAFFGLTSVLGGLYLCVWLDSAGGGAIMVFCTLQFLVVLFFAPKYGLSARWLRMRRMVPQQILEDVLGAMIREPDRAFSPSELRPLVGQAKGSDRAAANLVDQGLLAEGKRGLVLTETGKKEALKILRAHRLWEAYLAHVGRPGEEIHPKAHELEHVNDPESLAVLDDLLGHPVQDPHGQEIPEDQTLWLEGPAPASLLRPDREARVVSVGARAENLGLEPGRLVRLKSRSDDGAFWTLTLEPGRELVLSHEQADQVLVELV